MPGVLDKDKNLIKQLKVDDIRGLIADGTITGGMIPKVETCIYAIERGVEGVVILDGKIPHAVLIELLTDHGAGTLITAEARMRSSGQRCSRDRTSAMRILAIDTSCGAASAAVYDGDARETLAAETRAMAHGHAEALAPMVERVMREVEGGFATIGRVAVCVGPGSFTGIRVGLAMARAIGAGARGPGRRRLDAGRLRRRRCSSEPRPGVIVSAIDAKHGNVYFQLFESTGRPIFAARRQACATPCAAIGARPGAAGRRRRRGYRATRRSARRSISTRRRRRPIPTSSRSRGSGSPLDPGACAAASALRQAARRAPDARRRDRARRRLSGRARWSFAFVGPSPSRHPPLCAPNAPRNARRIHAGAFAHPWSAARVRALLRARSTLGSAALDPGDRPLRGFALSRLAADEAEILTIAVDPAWRRRGVGRDLLRAICGSAALAGARAMFLEVDEDNAAALALYARFGFIKVGERAGYYRRRTASRRPRW